MTTAPHLALISDTRLGAAVLNGFFVQREEPFRILTGEARFHFRRERKIELGKTVSFLIHRSYLVAFSDDRPLRRIAFSLEGYGE